MRRFFSCLLAAFSSLALADEPKTMFVPLNAVWAHSMPDTQDISELQKEFDEKFPPMKGGGNSPMAVIGRVLDDSAKDAGKAFAVEGIGLKALINAHHVLTDASREHRPTKSLSAETEVSIIFFAKYSSRYVHLREISRSGMQIQIRYALLPHRTANRTCHFAVIPMGKLPSGKYEVELSPLPLTEELTSQGFREVDDAWKRRYVSSSFSFQVE